ncbi:LysR substrate-binding domain-containing protein [Acidimangrovimonas sediminis]|uniref:LysR substrate-binding domain-containing protein n=1 Tax=Acidimangrovimonas sediminis TaxID=2056283 RepID=UPI000C7F8033|nr:LysR substrate-binding domain-containing protein [Acidimangrovimonas sediminis]
MDIRQLRHFVAVAETLHFGRAAEKLGMTQPPLSQSIRALEEELGAALFVRTRRSVALSPFGAEWLPHVQAALKGVAGLKDSAGRILRGQTGRLDLSFVSTADYSVLPLLVSRFRAARPEVELSLTEATSDRQFARLAAGEGQVGIVIPPGTDRLPPSLTYRRLGREPLVAAVPESWIAGGRIAPAPGGLAAAQVIDAPLIVFPRTAAPAFHDLVTGYFTARGGAAQVVQTAIQMQTIVSLVSAGIGIALVPASLRNLARVGVRYLDLADSPPMLETGLAWSRDDTSPILQAFLQVAEEVREEIAAEAP